MLRIIFIFVISAFYITCNGDASQNDWKNQGFYRPRRNFPSQSQNQNSFQSSYSQNTQNHYAFGTRETSSNNQHFGNQFTSNTLNRQNTNVFGTNGRSSQNQNIFGAASYTQIPQIQNQNGASFSQNSQRQNSFITSNSQNYKNVQNQNSFGASNSQNNFKTSFSSNHQSQNSFKTTNSQNPFGDTYISSQNQNSRASYLKPQSYAFGNSQNLQRQNPFRSSFGNNAYQFQNVNSNRQVSFESAVQKPFKAPEYLPPRKPYVAPGYLPGFENPKTSTTKRPVFTTTTKRQYYTTTTRRPLSTTTTTRRHIYTTTTRRPFNATTTTRKYYTTTTTRPIFYTEGTGEIRVGPAMAMLVPPEDDPTTTTTFRPFSQSSEYFPQYTIKVAPAMASLVPPEPEDDPTTTTTRTVKTTTPSTTILTTQSTTTTTPSTTTTTTTSTTTTTTPSTTTTTSTPPPTMVTTTPEVNRYLIEEDPRTTTTTTTTTFKAPEYLPPKFPPGPAPAMAIPVPPECDPSDPSTYPPGADQTSDDPCTPSKITTTITPPTTTTTTAPSTTTTPRTTTTTKIPFKALEYLPPRDGPPPAPAMAMPVPPEPECDLSNPTYPGIDFRSSDDPCSPPKTTMKPPSDTPACLPPAPKKRVARSSKTLRLDDVKGARPVWHAGIYDKTSQPYRPICGGSIVRMDVVISAAHCFWEDDSGLQPAENYAIGANKIYRPWADTMDKRVQKSDVKEIKIPSRFRGVKASFQDDLAVLKLATPFKYAKGLRPVCVDFDDGFDRDQLKEGNSGTIAGWGYTDAVGSQTSRLLWLELPYVEIERCIAGADQAFLKYITSDKVCAGENMTGKALCRGDSGGGLVFWDGEPDDATPFLRAVASTAPSAENLECNVQAVGTFTEITSHRRFLKEHVPGIGDECHYKDY